MKKILKSMVAIAIIVSIVACGSDNHKQSSDSQEYADDQNEIIERGKQISELSQQIEQYRKADSTRIAEGIIATKVEDSLNTMNLFPLGILPMWNGSKVIHASQYVISDGSLNDSFRWAVLDLFEESGYNFLRKAFITNPAIWQKVFLSEQARIGWLKKKLNLSTVDVDILPYLKDEYSTEGFHKEYLPSFKKFYAIHSISTTDGVWYHPKWQEFEDNFFKSFPEAFGGDHSKFGRAYKLWLSAHKIPAPAKKTLASIIEQYNAL